MQHKHYDLCLSAHRNTSFVPEHRAARDVKDYEQAVATVLQHGGDVERLDRLFRAWMSAKSRCASSMITGPARFNTHRAEKANNAERKHAEAYFSYLERVQRPPKKPRTAEGISQRLEALKKRQAEMLAFNAAMRKGDQETMLRLCGGNAELVARMCDPKQFGGPGFASFTLTNINAKVKRLEAIVSASAEATQQEDRQTRYTVDTEGQRVFFEFDGKPDELTRDILKRHGFKWTPSKGHWGRILTPNALAAAKSVSNQMKAPTGEKGE